MSNPFKANFDKAQVALDISRSTFALKHNLLGTADAGNLNICYCEEVLPGDTFNLKSAALARMATPIHPSMSNAYMNVEFFFVPNRLVWDHWEEFLGVNKDTFWSQTTTYTVPQVSAPSGGWSVGSLADQLGIPTGIAGLSVSALPFRAYALIYNYFWRDKNLQYAAACNTDDTNRTGSNGTNYITDVQLGGMPAKACKLPDMFTRALPAPQKGVAVSLPLGSSAPVYTSAALVTASNVSNAPMKLRNTDGTFITSDLNLGAYTGNGALFGKEEVRSGTQHSLQPYNLYADLSSATAAKVNDLRLAFATQRILEAQARAGCSYQELLHGLFNVTAGDSRLQQPEFLGGKSFPISMSQVVQTSSTDTTSPQGNTAAFSLSYDKDIGFTKSFVEHGIVLGVYTIRNENLYQQGLPRFFRKKDRYDYYWPQMANIGEVGIRNSELYAQGPSAVDGQGRAYDDQIFGYQEAWYEYRNHASQITGEFRSTYAQSLDSWHYADDYSSLPVLGSTWISADKANIARTLAVQNHSQFLVNFYFYNKATRTLPIYSVPGLIDHH